MLLLHHLPVLHWAIGGALIGVITLALLYLTNRRLGISTGFENVCSLVSRAVYFRRAELVGPGRWRLPCRAGLVGGGVASALLSGGWAPTWELGLFDAQIGGGPALKAAWMFAGGLLIGFGTRLAGGCTSGHGIFGISNFEKSSWVATLCFMAAGLATTQLVYRVLAG
jgi:uncharacterized membrane protein YedE/YeeE